MTERGKMRANLVSAAGVQFDFDQREPRQALQDAPIRAGLPASRHGGTAREGGTRGHANAAMGIARDGEINRSGIARKSPVNKGEIDLFHRARAKLPREGTMRRVGSRDDQDA